MAFASSVTVILTGPLVEEWLFRGVLWTSMMRMSNPLITTFVTAGLFTICHGPDRVPDFPELFLSGLLFGMLRYRTNSLLPGVLAHSLGNLAATFAPCLAV